MVYPFLCNIHAFSKPIGRGFAGRAGRDVNQEELLYSPMSPTRSGSMIKTPLWKQVQSVESLKRFTEHFETLDIFERKKITDEMIAYLEEYKGFTSAQDVQIAKDAIAGSKPRERAKRARRPRSRA